MSVAKFVRGGVSTAVLVTGFTVASGAFAQDAGGTPVLTALDSSNPNISEWSLINLTATDVASAKGGAGVKVALLDGVTDCRHQDLAGRCSYNLLSGGTYHYYSNHGTHTAGIIAGSRYGIATSATVINYAVFDDKGFVPNSQQLVNVWKSAYQAGARISSMSFGCSQLALCFSAAQVSAMADASRPMLYVKAAGNDGLQLLNEAVQVNSATANAALNRTLLVGSVDATGTISYFSNQPGENCLLPSGTSICSESLKWKNHFLVAPGEAIYSTLPGYSYGYMSGTSMATPVVAGVAALLQQRWPALKNSPETLARILLTTATDLGAPGVDAVYGYGLLNVARAFQANGSVTLLSSSGSRTTLSGSSLKTSVTLAKLASVLGDVTVYDEFGRDFSLAETGGIKTSVNLLARRQFLGRRLLASVSGADWRSSFFADEMQAHGFAMFGSAAEAPGSILAIDRTARMGIDMPFKGGVAQFRLTGAGDARQDFAQDATMRPLGYFASTSLLRGAFIGNAQIKLSGGSRLMVYTVTTPGAIDPHMGGNPLEMSLGEQGYMPRAAFTRESTGHKQIGFGVGYWTKAGDRTVLGVNASLMMQTGGYYTLTSDIADLQQPTKMFNLGGAAIRTMGNWELSLSGELTHLRMDAGGRALSFTPATLVSGDIAVRKNNVFTSGPLNDSIALSVSMPPKAIAGSLKLDYMTPTADGMDLQATTRLVPLALLGSEPVRMEGAYRISSGAKWSFNVSGGVNLAQAPGLGVGEGMATFRLAF